MRWLSFLLLLGLTGCLHQQKPVWTKVPTADQLIDKISTVSGRFLSLDGSAKVALTAKGKYFSSQQFLLLQKPDHLRADVLTGFGQLVLQITSDGDLLSVFLNTSVPGRFLRGPASNENIYRFVRIPLATSDLLALLLYNPPLIDYQDKFVELRSGVLKLILVNNDNKEELLFDQQLQLVGCHYYRRGAEYLAVDYRDFSKDNDFPHVIEIAMPEEETRVKVTFSELKVNEVIDISQFHLQPPGNISVESLP